jgi:hypothetical protein
MNVWLSDERRSGERKESRNGWKERERISKQARNECRKE